MSCRAPIVHAAVPSSSAKKTAVESKKRVTIKKPKKGLSGISHVPTATMVNTAISNLKERGGSSTKTIKRYVSDTYKIDGEKAGPLIRKYLKAAADKGLLTRTKGKGASGSFKIKSITPVKSVTSASGITPSSAPRKPRAVIKLKKPKPLKKATASKAKSSRKTSNKTKKIAKKPKTSKLKTKKVVKKRGAKK